MTRELMFARFVEATYSTLLAFLLQRVGNYELAEDLAQAAYLAVFRHPGFDPARTDAFGFLRRKACWLVQDHRRRLPRTPEQLPPDFPDQETDDPQRLLELDEVRDRVWSAIARLSETHRAILCRHLRGKSHRQIAADLALPIQTVYGRFHQAKAALRSLLREEGRPSAGLRE